MADYTFDVVTDTLNGKVIETKLADEIQGSAISSATLLAVGVSGATTERDRDGALSDGTITCTFDATLTSSDETTLGNVVANHTGQLSEAEKEENALAWYAEAQASQSTTNDTFVDAVSLSVEVPSGIYELLWYAELANLDSLTAESEARCTVNGGEQGLLRAVFSNLSTAEQAFVGMRARAVSGGTLTVKLQWRRVGGLATDSVSIRRARILLKKLRDQ